jgi:hypothetical protein
MAESVYLINAKTTNTYKIGRSATVNDRIKAIQTSNGYKIILIKTFDCLNCKMLEKRLHNLFKINRMQGEWFSFTESELNNCILEAQKISDDINTKLTKNTCNYCSYSTYRSETFNNHLNTDSHKKNEQIANLQEIILENQKAKLQETVLENQKSNSNVNIVKGAHYECIRCLRFYSNKYDYNRHLNRKNPCKLNSCKGDSEFKTSMKNSNIFTCGLCNKDFTRKDNLNRHYTSCNKKQEILHNNTTINNKVVNTLYNFCYVNKLKMTHDIIDNIESIREL